MSSSSTGRQASNSAAAAASQSSSGTPPTYSADVVQRLLDEAAYFHVYSSPEIRPAAGGSQKATADVIRAGEQVIGFHLHENLRRFEVEMHPPTSGSRMCASNIAGEQIGTFESRWLFCPDDFEAVPDCDPPPTRMDPMRRQRFVMLDGNCSLGNKGDGFRGFGTGSSFPSADGTLLAAAVGNVMNQSGRLAGLVGTYTYCGSLNSGTGFRGSLMLRLMDPHGVISTTGARPAIEGEKWPERGVTYLMFRGQARESDKVSPLIGPAGQPLGLNVAQQLRLFQADAARGGRGKLFSTNQIGPVIGEIDAQIVFNPAAPGGGALDPIPYTAFDEYKFTDQRGKAVGSLFIDEGEGRTFNLRLDGAPGQPAIRFGGFGPILRGTGNLEGSQGLMTDNSVVSFTPHVSASVYVIRMSDPQGCYRTNGYGRDF